jgi:uncharacterized repeat protein (TIGR01451 family)
MQIPFHHSLSIRGIIMKKQWAMISLGVLAVGAIAPVNGAPAIAQVINAGTNAAQNILRQPKVNLNLTAEQQVIAKDAAGKTVATWQPANQKVKSGDVLRFTVAAKNEGTKAAQNFALTQPVPKGTVLVLNSAQASTAANVVYSIDQGKTFVAKPVVKVTQPDGSVKEAAAPATAYTHVRWNVPSELAPNQAVNAAYQVSVR